MRTLFARLLVVLALTGAGTTAGAATAVSAPALAAGSQPCVGVVVDARPVGGSVSVRCSQGAPGRNSVQVLQDAGFRVRISASGSYAGFLCQINGLPASSGDDDGCGEDAADYRYWGFFLRAPGEKGWTYSSRGARGHKPVDGGQIGFRFQTTQTEQAPPVYAQDKICTPKPSTGPSRPAAAAPASKRPANKAPVNKPPVSRTPTSKAPARPTGPRPNSVATTGPAAVGASAASSPGPSGQAAASASPVEATPTASASAGAILPENGEPVPAGNELGAGEQEPSSSSGVPLTGLLGVLLLVALGVVAFLRQRSRQPR